MSAHTKARHTNRNRFIEIVVGIPGKQESIYKIPNTRECKERLQKFLRNIVPEESWDETTPWREIATDRISKHTEQGIALRGARYKRGLSQKELAKLCEISQDNLSRMENGKRVIGEKVARKLGAVLNIDYRLFMKKTSAKAKKRRVK